VLDDRHSYVRPRHGWWLGEQALKQEHEGEAAAAAAAASRIITTAHPPTNLTTSHLHLHSVMLPSQV
jgi:hypothetical protein